MQLVIVLLVCSVWYCVIVVVLTPSTAATAPNVQYEDILSIEGMEKELQRLRLENKELKLQLSNLHDVCSEDVFSGACVRKLIYEGTHMLCCDSL